MADDTLQQESGDWVAERLKEIKGIADASQQVEALVNLAGELLPSRAEVLKAALDEARAIEDDPTAQAIALSAIAPYRPASEQRAWLERALTAVDNIQDDDLYARDFYKAQALSAIAPRLPASDPTLLKLALTVAEKIKDAVYKFEALSAIAPYLPVSDPALLKSVLTAVVDIQCNYLHKALALIAIVPCLPASDPTLLEIARTSAEKIKDDADEISEAEGLEHQALALSAFALHMPESEQRDVLESALTAAKNLANSGSNTVIALSAIAPYLPISGPDLLERALTIIKTTNDDHGQYKAIALSAIASRLPASDQRAVLDHALTIAENIQDDDLSKAITLSTIAPHLPASEPALLKRALTAAENIEADEYKARALGAIAARLPACEPALLERTLTAAGKLKDHSSKAQVLSAIAPRLPASEQRDVLESAFTALDNIHEDYDKVFALSKIAPHLPASEPVLLKRARIAAEKIDGYNKALALSAIAPYLPLSEQKDLVESALTAAENIQDNDWFKALALSAIAPRLSASDPELLERALTAVNTLKDNPSKALALSAIAPRLSASEQCTVLAQALTAAENIKAPENNEPDRRKAEALSVIAPRLPASELKLLERALTAAEKINNDEYKALALSGIAPNLPESKPVLLERVLNAAENLQDSKKVRVLIAIIPRLSASKRRDVLETALTTAENIKEGYDKARALSAIAPWVTLNNLKRFCEATFGLPDGAYQIPSASESLASPATQLTKDFLRLYPSNRHSTALNIVTHIPNDADKTKFLSALIPCLAVGLLPNTLRLIQETFKGDRYRTETLNNLVTYLPTDQTSEALKLIDQFIKNPYYQTAALVDLIPLLPIEHFGKVLDLLKAKIALPQHHASILQAIAKTLTTPEHTDKLASATSKASTAMTQADKAFLNAYRGMVKKTLTLTHQLKESKRDDFSYERAAFTIFSQLAPVLKHLEEPEQPTLNAVEAIEDPGYKAALIALAPYFKDSVQTFLKKYTGNDYRNLLNIKIQLALIDDVSDSSNPPDLSSTLSTAESIESPYRKAEAWVEVASHPAGAIHQTQALRAIRELQNNAYLQTQYLQRLIPHLAYQQRLEAANIINDISDSYHKVSARVALARKFPEPEFFEQARDGALDLTPKDQDKSDEAKAQALALLRKGQVQTIEQLSILAIDMPDLLPKIIKLAEMAKTANSSDTTEEEEESQESSQQGNTCAKNIDRYGILVALAPHLPMRINREVKRTWCLSNTITYELWDRALHLLARSYRDAVTAGSLRNESAQDKDFLNLQDDITGLSDLLLMRDLEPPMTVGILGGWGGGKSYIMHLMQQRMTEVRSLNVDLATEAWNENPNHEKLSPYVGHIYQIKFDAWTFAKSDLWASLMQTIFFELNRQISLEQQLARVLADNPEDATSRAKVLCEAGQYWPVLYKASEQDRQWFLERVLSPAQLAKFKNIHNQGQVDDELWEQLGATYEAENQKLTELEAELHHKQDELRSNTQAIRNQVDDNQLNQLILKLTGPVSILLSNRISQPVLKRINQDITRQVKEQLGSQAAKSALEPLDIEHLNAIVQAVATGVFDQRYGEISFRSFLTWFKKNLRLFGLLVVFLTLAILLPIAADALLGLLLPGLDSAFPRLIAFLAPLTPGLASAQTLLKSSQKWAEETNLAVKEYEQQLEALPKLLDDRREQLFHTKLDKVKEVADLEADVKQLEEKVNAQRQRIPKNVYASLEAFVSDRIQDGSYEKRLGLMQQVKGDLAELSNRLLPPPANSQEFQWKIEQLQKVFPRGPARVVVYIDDLDRCPPRRVVQVLEAVQLLVKTPLFIAVLAIDERYITRALEQFYKGVLLRHGSPSGTDYLEKIIQLPYRVRPIMADTLETYLRSQIVIQDNATTSTRFSGFSRQEFNMLLACCKQVDLTPRTLKRFTNVYKVFKLVYRAQEARNKPSRQVQQATLALLALSGRYPNLMRGIFEAIETVFEEQRDEAAAKTIDIRAEAKANSHANDYKVEYPTLHLQSPLRDFFENYQLPDYDRYLQLEFDKLQHDALHTDILPPTLTLEAMTHEIFNLIRSFSFVGEIGEDSKDYGFSGSSNPEN